MGAERDLERLLADMDPVVVPGAWVFVTSERTDLGARASVVEPEGTSLLVPLERATAAGLPHELVCGWVTLRVHSALDAVGLTAAVAAALTEQGISCNVVAGRHHDHLLVPLHRRDDTLDVLRRLADGDRPDGARAVTA
jgi:hypothetical protein